MMPGENRHLGFSKIHQRFKQPERERIITYMLNYHCWFDFLPAASHPVSHATFEVTCKGEFFARAKPNTFKLSEANFFVQMDF